VAFNSFEDSFFCLTPCGALSNSWHVSFPLSNCDTLHLLAAAEWEATQAEKQALLNYSAQGGRL
jgi:hypothetical protein